MRCSCGFILKILVLQEVTARQLRRNFQRYLFSGLADRTFHFVGGTVLGQLSVCVVLSFFLCCVRLFLCVLRCGFFRCGLCVRRFRLGVGCRGLFGGGLGCVGLFLGVGGGVRLCVGCGLFAYNESVSDVVEAYNS